ncbi:tRNA-splicing endonuclease subunit Sen54-like [Diorhabda carinulata]|uniref:tRNA-splicing endonuclease subunit Sen54-like n=1 Tax=Diorhabda carinulata TaxID=1163345 RepID=UPI0025A2118B|nr:tRNA-splicing endonuclease subunit Sen54-like [Diorhabda carinulata]
MDEEVKDIIKCHRNPLTKVDLIGPKLFSKDSSLQTRNLISKNLESLENALRNRKVEKRCSRAQAEWDESLNLAKVNKVVKGLLENFGYQNKHGIYMYPEEMLYLVETNRMEVSVNKVPLTVQECFNIVLNSPEMQLIKYRVYKKLIHLGYKVFRYSEFVRKFEKIENKETITQKCGFITNNEQQKRQFHDPKEETNHKKVCVDHDRPDAITLKNKCIENMYGRLKQIAPQKYVPGNKTGIDPDYCVFQSKNPSKTDLYFNVYICETNILDHVEYFSKHPSLYVICSGDNISLYKMGVVNIPTIQLNLDD